MSRYVFALVLLVVVAVGVSAVPPEQPCPENMFWSGLGRMCEPSCEDPSFRLCSAPLDFACRCMEGFYRNGDRCIPLSECPKH
ncbi:serine protease inhibitor swm-1-like [Hylaeus anthracinus]|uniref:serine protease inhibitor swm-1-like n=1 Tax=Hylaeus anthracinus TaxID=313031 RepID=UPI0023B88A26|nr:serine protease inhibitor swm-1-like [Hylaeus anthracinus]